MIVVKSVLCLAGRLSHLQVLEHVVPVLGDKDKKCGTSSF